MNTNATATSAPTEKQVAFLVSLSASRTPHVEEVTVRAWAAGQTRSAVSKKIDWLKSQPVVAGPLSSKAQWEGQQAKHQPEPEDGIYVVKGDDPVAYSYVDRQDLVPFKEDVVYKVYKMVHGSGRQGVKRLVVNADKTGSFEYVGLAAKHLPKNAVLMPLEDAKAFGRIYGFCVRCGRTLTDEESIAAGIGPVCSGKWA